MSASGWGSIHRRRCCHRDHHGQDLGGGLYATVAAAQCRRRGYGTLLYDFACDLLFTDLPPDVAHGYVIAECLPLRFWDARLERTPCGLALGHLLAAHFPAHQPLRDACTFRAVRLARE